MATNISLKGVEIPKLQILEIPYDTNLLESLQLLITQFFLKKATDRDPTISHPLYPAPGEYTPPASGNCYAHLERDEDPVQGHAC